MADDGTFYAGEVVLYKKIVQVGYPTLIDDRATSVIVSKVQCMRTVLVDVGRCMRCPNNRGLHNHYLMACGRKPGTELPDVITTTDDSDYPVEPEKEKKAED